MGAMVGQPHEELAHHGWGVPCQVEGATWSARGLDREESAGGWPNNGTVHETEQATTNRHHQYP